jgi:hypothetical protein
MTDIDLLLTEIDHLKSQLLRERQISGAAREHHLRNLKIKDAEIGRLRNELRALRPRSDFHHDRSQRENEQSVSDVCDFAFAVKPNERAYQNSVLFR